MKRRIHDTDDVTMRMTRPMQESVHGEFDDHCLDGCRFSRHAGHNYDENESENESENDDDHAARHGHGHGLHERARSGSVDCCVTIRRGRRRGRRALVWV